MIQALFCHLSIRRLIHRRHVLDHIIPRLNGHTGRHAAADDVSNGAGGVFHGGHLDTTHNGSITTNGEDHAVFNLVVAASAELHKAVLCMSGGDFSQSRCGLYLTLTCAKRWWLW